MDLSAMGVSKFTCGDQVLVRLSVITVGFGMRHGGC